MGFERNLEAEMIIGASNASGELLFLIKWKGTEEANLVPAKQANIQFPQVVIQYYEDISVFDSSPNDESESQ